MLKKIKQARSAVFQVLSKRNYFIIFIVASALFFYVLYKLTLATIANQSFDIFVMMLGVWYTFADIVLLMIISLLFGTFVSVFIYKINLARKVSKTGFLGSLGMTVGLFSAGCPTCGAVLFGLIGMPLALMLLPFKGLELKVLSIILMFVSIYFLSSSLINCKVRKK